MTEDYLKTIVQYLVKIVNNSGVSDKDISDKLDEVIAAVSNIKISAESVNLNTDEVEAKLDTLNQSIIANGDKTDIIEKLTVLGTKLDTVKSSIEAINTSIESVETGLGQLIVQNYNKLHDIDTKVQSIGNSMLNNGMVNPRHIKTVPAGDFTLEPFGVLCNITNDYLTVTVTAADDVTAQTITLAPGWNPVIVKSITGAVENTLVYGY